MIFLHLFLILSVCKSWLITDWSICYSIKSRTAGISAQPNLSNTTLTSIGKIIGVQRLVNRKFTNGWPFWMQSQMSQKGKCYCEILCPLDGNTVKVLVCPGDDVIQLFWRRLAMPYSTPMIRVRTPLTFTVFILQNCLKRMEINLNENSYLWFLRDISK